MGQMGSMELVELRARTRMSEKGRVVIPAAMREAIGIGVGDALDWRVEDGELRIRRAQERASRYVKPGTLISDELSAERREAAKHE
jgi:AbrB family looped-hinge helix DNA binding protein